MNRIRFFRRQANLTQMELAKAVGVNRLKVLRWEKGLTKVPWEARSGIASALGLDYRLIFPEAGDEPMKDHR